jgi:hypothetical protein
MQNPVLESLRAQRAEQISTMDAILAQVEERDLVDAERGLLEACRDRIGVIDAQIAPLAEYEALRGAHAETVAALPAPTGSNGASSRRLDVAERAPIYRTAGEFLVDYLRAHGIYERGTRDEQAAARVMQARAVGDQTTGSTPGLMPSTIVGGVVNLIDANRPLITSLGGAKAMGGIPGTAFGRPKITVHALAGKQSAEKTALATRAMTISNVQFTKETHGGTVDISRQDIDWSSPAAWDILVRDLADVYAVETETTVAAAFKAAATGTAPPALPAAPTLSDWSKALYTAAMHSYSAGGRMPDRIWCGLDVWAALGSLVDTARLVMPQGGNQDNAAGSSTLADFRGDVLGLPRVVVPTFPAKTCIVGNSTYYEAYEEVIGLLSVIEPSILGVQVAYGGYLAYGAMAPTALIPLDLTAVTGLPTALEASVLDVDDDDAKPGNGKAGK